MMEGKDNNKLRDLAIAVIDGNILVQEGYRSLLCKIGVENIQTFVSEQAFLPTLQNGQLDVYIIGIGADYGDGIAAIDEIRQRYGDAKVLVVAIQEDAWLIRKIMEKEPNAVLYPNADQEEIRQALTTIAQGGKYFCRGVRHMVSRYRILPEEPSQREIDVLVAMASGYTSKEIATKLFISENTVEAHRKSLFAKLNARNLADLMVKGIAHGYINPNDLLD